MSKPSLVLGGLLFYSTPAGLLIRSCDGDDVTVPWHDVETLVKLPRVHLREYAEVAPNLRPVCYPFERVTPTDDPVPASAAVLDSVRAALAGL